MINRFSMSPFARAVAVLSTGIVVAQAIPIVLTPLMSRLFTPEEFGQLGLFTSFLSMTAAAVGLSLPQAIVSGASRRIAAQLVAICFVVAVPVSTIFALVLLVLRTRGWLGFDGLPLIGVPSIWITLIVMAISGAFRNWLIREDVLKPVRRATIGRGISRGLLGLLAGIVSLGGPGLILAEVAGRFSGLALLVRTGLTQVRESLSGTNRVEYFRVFADHKKYVVFGTPSAMINSIALALPGPLLAATYGLSVAGQFTMSYRILALPLSLVGSAVADVFHRQLSKLSQTAPERARSLFLKIAVGLFLVGLIPMGIVLLFGPAVFEIVLGDQWREAGVIASGIAPWLLASLVVSPLSRVVYVYQGQELKLVYDILALAGVIVGIVVGWNLDWPIHDTARLLGVTQSLAYLVYFGLLWRILTANSEDAQGVELS